MGKSIVLVFRPGSVGQLDVVVLDVDESCFVQVLCPFFGGVRVGAEFGEGFDHELGEALDGPVIRDAVIVGAHIAIDVLQLNPSTRSHIAVPLISRPVLIVFDLQHVRISLLEDLDRRLENRHHVAQVDKVKIRAIEPRSFDVVHVEPVQVSEQILAQRGPGLDRLLRRT